MNRLRTYTRAALAILLGERCIVCGRVLPGAGICPSCLLRLPYINIKGVSGNPMERIFWGAIPIVRASSMLIYHPGSIAEPIIHAIKYHDRPDLAVELGRMMAQEHLPHGFFEGIDAIQPVPLHIKRQRQRGYNQSERLARGISEVTGIKIVDVVRRRVDNVSQTRLSHEQRKDNVREIFAVDREAAAALRLKHILIVDDVITTGSTTINCAQAITGHMLCDDGELPDLRVSILSLAYAGTMHIGRLSAEELHRADCTVSNEEFRQRQYAPLG